MGDEMQVFKIGLVCLAVVMISTPTRAQYDGYSQMLQMEEQQRQQRDWQRQQERRLDQMQQDIEDQAYRQMDLERQRQIDRAIEAIDPNSLYLRR